MTKKQTVFVGLSGGVDSSVAALRLKTQGYHVVGVFIKVWQPQWLSCNWEKERLDAMRVAAKLDIPFLTFDAEEAYKKNVADYFIQEYREGRTPNPDVMCNKHVKFGSFLEYAQTHNADFVATGHYAQVKQLLPSSEFGEYAMYRGIDTQKDQSYFLWTLTQRQLAKILFPVGDSPKSQIRKEAKRAGLLTADKKDSQGVCFLGHIDIPEFLSHYISLQEGPVLDTDGNTVGTHKGSLLYTNGQRHGFTIHSQDSHRRALYVIHRDIEANTITVSPDKPYIEKGSSLRLQQTNFIGTEIDLLDTFEIQTRYRQKPVPAQATEINTNSLQLQPITMTEQSSVGQSCVLYRGNRCLGGGIIS